MGSGSYVLPESLTRLKSRGWLGLWSYLRLRVLFLVPRFWNCQSLEVVGLWPLLSCWLSTWVCSEFMEIAHHSLPCDLCTAWQLLFKASSRTSSFGSLWPQGCSATSFYLMRSYHSEWTTSNILVLFFWIVFPVNINICFFKQSDITVCFDFYNRLTSLWLPFHSLLIFLMVMLCCIVIIATIYATDQPLV